jgi:AcrR family transcriptional regulator
MSDIASARRSSQSPASPPRRRLPAAQRRQTLIAAASELFAQRGYDNVSLDEVAGRAGVTKVIVYRHFSSKKDLYLRLLAIHRDELLGVLAEGMAAEMSLADRVPAVADAWFSYVERSPFAWAMLFQDVTGDPEIRTFHASMRDAARSAIVGLLAAERTLRLERSMLEPVAELLRSAMTGLALWWLEHSEVPRAILVESVTQTAWLGLASARGRKRAKRTIKARAL